MRGILGTYHKKVGWQPGANTFAYYPLNGDTLDYSGNSRNLSVFLGTASYDTVLGTKKCGNFNATGNTTGGWAAATSSTYRIIGDITVSYWANLPSASWVRDVVVNRDKNTYVWMDNIVNDGRIMLHGNQRYTSTGTITYNQWQNIICVVNNGNLKFYINGNIINPTIGASYNFGGGTAKIVIGASTDASSPDERLKGKVADIIIETKARTAAEISDYFNLTKSLYGIS